MHSMLWRRLDSPGHEAAWLMNNGGSWRLSGTAIFAYRTEPCCLHYVVLCNESWQTRSASVVGSIGKRAVECEIQVDGERHWTINGEESPTVSGCHDLDLNFSPSTNSLPIRRLALGIGASADVRAAWLRFPELALEPLEQRYHRISGGRYRYESDGGAFLANLDVNEAGFVTRYPGFWHAEYPG